MNVLLSAFAAVLVLLELLTSVLGKWTCTVYIAQSSH